MKDDKIKTAYYIIGIFLVSVLALLIYNSQINKELVRMSPGELECMGTRDFSKHQCNSAPGGCREQINKCKEKQKTSCPEDKCIQGDMRNTCTDVGKSSFCNDPNKPYEILYTCKIDCSKKPVGDIEGGKSNN